jgi:hypothetical protein
MITKKILLPLFAITLSACSSPGIPSNNAESTEEKTPQELPLKKSETYSRCKISNGAGRIFHATDESRDIAEAKARHECQIYSRHCQLLDCSLTTEED